MKNIPEIRIKGFEGEWKEKLIGDISDSFSGGTPNAHEPSYYGGKIPFIRSGEIESNKTELFLTDKGYQNSSAKIVEKGTLLYALYGATSGEVAISNINGAINQAILAIYPHKGYDSVFMHYWLKANKKDIISTYLQGGQGNLSGELVKSIKILFPNLAEQQSLGSFFSSFDRLLSDHHRRLENLRRVKKSMLQKMFPQQGQTVPEIRFKGFSGEWEKAKLSDIASFSKGRGYSKNDLTTKGNGKPIILYGRMYTNYEFVINNVDTSARPLPNSVYSTGKEVIVPASGETAEDISIASAVISKGIILGGDLNIILPYDDILYPPFLALYITNSNVHYELSLKAQGKTIVHLHNDALEDLEILVPPISEQQRLSSFFTSLDNLINDEVNYIDQLTRVKSTLLQKMFV